MVIAAGEHLTFVDPLHAGTEIRMGIPRRGVWLIGPVGTTLIPPELIKTNLIGAG